MNRSAAEISLEEAHFPLILSLDFGSSSARALLFDAEGRQVSGIEARRLYTIPAAADGGMEVDADLLLDAVWGSIDEVLSQSRAAPGQIAGVCCDTFVSNLMGIDERGVAVTPLSIYADTRSAAQAEAFKTHLDQELFHQKVGTLFHPSYWPSRFVWMKENSPETLQRVQRWITLGDYLLSKVFDSPSATSYSAASWSGMLNRESLTWEPLWLQELGLAETNLARLVDVDQPWAGSMKAEFAARWPALAAVPWFPAIGDGAAANLGSGCWMEERVAVTMGTSSALRVVVPDRNPVIPPGLWCYRVDRRRSLLGGALSEGGNIFQWLKETLAWGGETFERELNEMEPDSHGLTFLPLLAGERAPGWCGSARGAITGISLSTRPVDLARAGLEGVAYRLGLVFRLLEPVLASGAEVVASGGALTHSKMLPQLLADVFDHPVTVSLAPEATARGSALLALEKLGLIAELQQVPYYPGQTFQPDARRHEIYWRAIERQQQIYGYVTGN